jgi:Ca-activated chloride channel family protein
MNAESSLAVPPIDFVQLSLDDANRHKKQTEEEKAQAKRLIDSGAVSALDLTAPPKAVEEFNRASTLLRAQNSKEAIKHLQKAIDVYPKFVSAHVGLGLAYIDQEDNARAKGELETAAKLDEKFPGSFINLGRMALSQKDFATGQSELEQAAALQPGNVRVLTDLAYAENGNHQYKRALETAQRVHALEHKGMATVHFTAAAAAQSLRDYENMQRELNLFLNEDPTNAFAPLARRNLEALTRSRNATVATAGAGPLSGSSPQPSQTFPNSDRLKAEVKEAGDEADGSVCSGCAAEAGASGPKATGDLAVNTPPRVSAQPTGPWTIRTNVDQVALFFGVSNHGRMVNDLELANLQILDADKAPERVVQFAPQSKLPLRLALLIDTSGSVHERFSFEKRAAARFIQRVLNPDLDLAYVAGFSLSPTVTQDFSSDPALLGKGIEKLSEGGGTSLFDAVSFSCSKLAAYPDDERVARALVILSDGEDNSSHTTLKQNIMMAERTGVTIYIVSTREGNGTKTDADKMLELMAQRSGGEAMFPGDMMTLDKTLDKLREVIRSRYFIAYKPANFQPDGSYRTIKIVAEKNGKRLQVRARKGYHARLEASTN